MPRISKCEVVRKFRITALTELVINDTILSEAILNVKYKRRRPRFLSGLPFILLIIVIYYTLYCSSCLFNVGYHDGFIEVKPTRCPTWAGLIL